jgi:hypothetical protein
LAKPSQPRQISGPGQSSESSFTLHLPGQIDNIICLTEYAWIAIIKSNQKDFSPIQLFGWIRQIQLSALIQALPERLAMETPKPKTFNTAGVCVPEKHYMLPVLQRLPEAVKMIESELYFAVHAPRQSGKSTFLKILANKINSEGKYYAVWCSLAAMQGVAGADKAMSIIVSQINMGLRSSEIETIRKLNNKYESFPEMARSDAKVRGLLNSICSDLLIKN